MHTAKAPPSLTLPLEGGREQMEVLADVCTSLFVVGQNAPGKDPPSIRMFCPVI
jgi:hypothetical protein